ncbi:hypothetical protein [Segetibacter aerophilus]|uniref:Uncharacterized protein n=1 Tax=Segetibacter aerophilus TaxID=670293 RepID=A0A512B770_9BACT|nr:hypothetical protein [Segetibacter aerophilus]GEO07813.1 hypothetical protein SAE01_03090 [Segetibacter aerophilus]
MRTIIVPLYGYLNSRIKKLWNLTKFAKKRSLHFSSHDEVGANIMALDVLKRKLLYAAKTPGTTSCLIIDLNDLQACSVKKEYSGIAPGELKSKKLHHFLKSIFLNLVFKNRTVSLRLYDAKKQQQGGVEQLETQAKKWQRDLSKLLPVHMKERA